MASSKTRTSGRGGGGAGRPSAGTSLKREGRLGIDDLGPLKDELLGAIEAGGPVTFDMRQVRMIDTPAAQLLMAARRECRRRKVSFKIRRSEEVADFLKSMGIRL